jgi:hypothetical protein
MQSVFQFSYEPEGAGVWVTSTSGLIGFKVEVERPTCLILKQGGLGSFDLRVFFKSGSCQGTADPLLPAFFELNQPTCTQAVQDPFQEVRDGWAADVLIGSIHLHQKAQYLKWCICVRRAL